MIADGDDKERGEQAEKTLTGKEKFEASKWKPGCPSPNPSGRPKGSLSMTSLLREALSASDKKRARAIIQTMMDKAEEGDARHLIEVLNRIDGKVPDKVQAEGDVRVVVEFVKEGDTHDADLPRTTSEPA